MASGTIKSNTGTSLNLIIEWSSTANKTSNSSSVTAKLYIQSYALYANDLGDNYITIDGSKKAFSCSQSYGGGSLSKRLIATYTKTVKHNSNGAKSITISGKWKFKGTYTGVYLEGITVRGTAKLDTIDVSVATPSSCSTSGWYATGHSVKISWPSVANADRYEVESRFNYGGTWKDWGGRRSVTGTSLTLNITATADIVQYRVRAVNGSVVSGWRTSSNRYHTFVTIATADGWKDWCRIKVWTGSEWKNCRIRRWTGSAWGRCK